MALTGKRFFVGAVCLSLLTIDAAAAEDLDIDPEILETVRHPELGLTSREVRAVERAAYYHVLKKARDTELSEQQAASRRLRSQRLRLPQFQKYRNQAPDQFPMFVDLIKNTKLYHGKLVTLRGRVRKLIVIAEKTEDIDTLYEAWMYTADSQNHPAVIVCTSVPENMPQGAKILVDHVSVTGYYFKNFGYFDQAKTARYAPMILAQRLEWRPPPPTPPPFVPKWLIVLIVVAGMGVAVIWVIRMSRQDRAFRRRRMQQLDHEDSDDNPYRPTDG